MKKMNVVFKNIGFMYKRIKVKHVDNVNNSSDQL